MTWLSWFLILLSLVTRLTTGPAENQSLASPILFLPPVIFPTAVEFGHILNYGTKTISSEVNFSVASKYNSTSMSIFQNSKPESVSLSSFYFFLASDINL